MLPDLIVASFFGRATAPAALKIGLAAAGVELVDDGYMRATVLKGDWQLVGPQAAATVEFGPFVDAVRFDEVIITAGDDVVARMPLDGELSLLAEMTYAHRVIVRMALGDVDGA